MKCEDLPVELRGLEPLTPCLQTTGSTSTAVHPRRSPSPSVYPRLPGSAPVAVLPCCTPLPSARTGGFREIAAYSEVYERRGGAGMTIAVEEKRVRSLFDRVEAVEDVARTLPENDERRAKLLAVSNAALADEGTIRPVIAARLLGLSEKTVRAWVSQGVIVAAQRTPRLLLDLQSVHQISHIVRGLRAHGKDRDLLDEVWRRLNDAVLLERADLQESIEQMHRGEGRVLRPIGGNSPTSR